MNKELESLKKAGLTDYESKAYIGLIRYGATEAAKLAEKTEVARPKVYEVLRSLEEKGLASKIQENPVKYSPVEPETGLKSLYQRKLEDIKHHEEKALEELEQIEEKEIEKPGIEEEVDVVLGRDTMFQHLTEKYGATDEELLILSVGEPIPNKLERTLKGLVERNVDLRFIASKNDEENQEVLDRFQERIGWKMRHYETSQDYTFSVRDRENVMINVRNPEDQDERISLFLEIPGLADALADYFEDIWGEAAEISV